MRSRIQHLNFERAGSDRRSIAACARSRESVATLRPSSAPVIGGRNEGSGKLSAPVTRREALSVAWVATDNGTPSLGACRGPRGAEIWEAAKRLLPTYRNLPAHGCRLEGGRKVGGIARRSSQPASSGEAVRGAFAQVSRQNRQTVSIDGRRPGHYGCIPEVAGSNPAPATKFRRGIQSDPTPESIWI